MTKRMLISVIVIAAFLLADKLDLILYNMGWIPEAIMGSTFTVLNKTLLYIVFPIAVLALLHGRQKALPESGLGGNFTKGMTIAFIGVLPMFLGAAFLANFQLRLALPDILIGCVLAATAEEILYRGFLFGQLFRQARWGFLPAAMVSAVIFGAGHLYQSSEPATALGIFAITFMGGLWFSWLYVEWDYNLWVPIGFHFFMNLSWTIFDMGDNALGSAAPNIFRALTIALSVYLTLRHKRQGSPKEVTGKRWWRSHA